MNNFHPNRIFLFFLIACFIMLSAEPAAAQQGKGGRDKASVRAAVISFYDWYAVHRNEVTAFKIIAAPQEPGIPSINWKDVGALHAFLKKAAPGLGPAFYTSDSAYLQGFEAIWKEHPADNGPFDYDRITQSQDPPQLIAKQLHEPSVKWDCTINSRIAYLTARGSYEGTIPMFVFSWQLRKTGQGWKIAQIVGDDECRQ